MKMPTFRNKKKVTLIAISAIAVVSVATATTYALQANTQTETKEGSMSSAQKTDDSQTAKKVEEVPEVKSTPSEDITPATTVPQAVETPKVEEVPPAEPTVDPELEKNCGMVNDTIAHIKATYTARGGSFNNQDILRDLSSSPTTRAAYGFYQQCVAAGKTQTL